MLLDRIAIQFGVSKGLVESIVASAPHRYKVYSVDKKVGSGKRTIAQPAKEVKAIQKFVVSEIINKLPIHHAAKAYVRGGGIKENARVHVTNDYLLKMDFENFFPSLKPDDLARHISKYMAQELSEEDVQVILNACFWKPRTENTLKLSIGGPSSPFISNSLMFDFDTKSSSLANELSVSYTRYADDLTFSTKSRFCLRKVEKEIEAIIIKLEYPNLIINKKKTIHVSKKYHRRVTGLVLSSQNKLSLGRARKRKIRAMAHRAMMGKLDMRNTEYLAGLLAFSLDVEPEFVKKLDEKYKGNNLLRLLSPQ